MPATQRGQAYRLGANRWGLRYYDAAGERRRKSPFPSKSAALAHYRDVIEPQLRGEPARLPDLTLAGLVDLYLERHAATVRWGYMSSNPAKLAGRNPQPPPRPVRAYTDAELEAIAAELSARFQPLP